jgi:hypothetical protein
MPVASPEIPASLERSQGTWAALFLFKLEKLEKLRKQQLRFAKKRAFLYIKTWIYTK